MPLTPPATGMLGSVDPATDRPITGADSAVAADPSWLTDACTITPRTPTRSAGSVHKANGTPVEDVPCWLIEMDRPTEVIRAGGARAIATFRLLLPIDTAVGETSKVTVGSQDFEVVGLDDGLTGALVLTVYLARLR